jgi:SAM-dependent methyltransferase
VKADYTRIFTDADAVDKYERVVYAPGSYSSTVSARQGEYLRDLVARRFAQPPTQHDFACGTGRALRLLHGTVKNAHGYDTSAEMLARATDTGAHLHEIPADGPVPEPSPVDGPALVTVFRLLLNVADEVRHRAIAFAARALPDADAGLLVVENHGNRKSLRHLGHARHADDPWYAELSHADVAALLAAHGFEIVERRGFALCPPGAYRRRGLRPLARRLDGFAARHAVFAGVATDVLYVARRSA